MTNREIFETLARARPNSVAAIAALLSVDGLSGTVRRVRVMQPLRESVSGDAFNLGEVLAVEAVANVGGREGYMLRLGEDRATALAAAAIMAVTEGDPGRRAEITNALANERAAQEYACAAARAATHATRVHFEGGEVEGYAASDYTTDR